MLRKIDISQAHPDSGAIELEFRFATVAPLQGPLLSELPGVSGEAVLVRVSPQLIATSRRDGGLAHSVGVFDYGDLKIGALFIQGGSELHVVLIEPAAPEARALFEQTKSSRTLQLLVVSDAKDCRLMLVPMSEALELLCDAARDTKAASTLEVTEAVALALKYLVSEGTISALGVQYPLPSTVVAHFVMTPSREADIERAMCGASPKH